MMLSSRALRLGNDTVIALVDNDEAILDALTLLLRTYGWKTSPHRSGERLLASLDSAKPDCLILETQLSDMSGPEVVSELATRNAQFPIIGLTAWPTSRPTAEVCRIGVSAMLTKPVSAETLVDVIRHAVSVNRD